jgi:hypothetical protein
MSSPTVSATSKGKNKHKQPTIISLLDSDDDDDIVLVGSSKPAVKAGPPQSEQVWKKMNITEKMDALKRERKCLRKACDSCTNEGHKKLIMARRNELRGLSAGLAFRIWEPPNPSLFKAIPFHKYDMSEALRATIKPPAPTAPDSAEPSSEPPGGGGALRSTPSSSTAIVSDGIPPNGDRAPSDMSGRATDALQAVNSTFEGLVNSMKSFAEGAGNLFNPLAQRLAAGGIGPTITGLPGPSVFPGGFDFADLQARRAQIEEEFGYEYDRPAE